MRRFAVLLSLALVLCLATSIHASTFIVDGSGGGDFGSIQQAVDAASAGDSILVQAGLYEETVKITPEKEGLLIRGQPGPDFVTVQGDTITVGIWGAQGPVRIEGLTLTGGGLYGAIFVQGGKVEFVNCVIKGNEGPGGCHGVGGGGQVIFFSEVLVEDCVFEQNRSWESPGGFIVWNSRADIRNNIFRQNEACYGGGLEMYHCEDNGPSVIEGNLFVGNQAEVWGGGILNVDSSPIIRNNTFVDNDGSGNAAVYVLGGRPEISYNIFAGSPIGVTCATLSGYPASVPDIGPNLVWDITDGEIRYCTPTDMMTNEDPRFCSPETGDYTLCSNSLAASGGYGAYGIGCDACGATRVESTTWGRIKASY